MSLILAIDLSTKPGIAVFKDGVFVLAQTVFNDKTADDFGKYPKNYVLFTQYTIERLVNAIYALGYKWHQFDNIILEETTPGRQNYSQKILEWLHYQFLLTFSNIQGKIVYIRDGTWKRMNDVKLSKEDKANNSKIKRLKQKTGKRVVRRDETGASVRKVNRKDVYIRVCNDIFGTTFSRRDEDSAAASLLGKAFLMGAPLCNGKITGGLLLKKV